MLTPKQEIFVQEYLKTGSQYTAYVAAYNTGNMKEKTIRSRAYEMLQKGVIGERIQAQQHKMAKKTEITVETITKMLGQAYTLAIENKQTGPAVAASMGLGKLHGLIVDKKEDVTVRRNPKEIDALLSQLIEHSKEDRTPRLAGGAGEVSEAETIVPDVPDDGESET